jgi:transketolase N-terminal domain/subunit
VKYAAIAWSCSLSEAKEWPNANHAGPYTLSNVVALLKRNKQSYLNINVILLFLYMY